MEAKELRIGNLVNTALGILRVEEIPLKSNPLYNPNALHPIPLTSEWLERLGFVFEPSDSGNDFWQDLKGLTIYESAIKGEFYCDILFDYTDVKCVHQLQNLYFALTGEELTVKDFLHK